MAKEWQDPLDVAPSKNTLVEVMGIPCAMPIKGKSQDALGTENREWRASAFMDNESEWRLPEVQMHEYMLLGQVFFNEVYRWRDLIP